MRRNRNDREKSVTTKKKKKSALAKRWIVVYFGKNTDEREREWGNREAETEYIYRIGQNAGKKLLLSVGTRGDDENRCKKE